VNPAAWTTVPFAQIACTGTGRGCAMGILAVTFGPMNAGQNRAYFNYALQNAAPVTKTAGVIAALGRAPGAATVPGADAFGGELGQG
jgi:hypothetical protein